jgi:hypothetical protein
MHPAVPLFIDEPWKAPAAGRTILVVNPATAQVIGSLARAEEGNLDRALEAAKKSFGARHKVSALLRQRADAIARLMRLEHGKPPSETNAVSPIAAPVENIALAHGTRVSGSGWRPVFEFLVSDEHRASVAEQPSTSFRNNVAPVRRGNRDAIRPKDSLRHPF